MNRQQKIAKLKNIMAGTVKRLDGETLCWSLEDDGFYYCENPKYGSFKYNREQLRKFTERNGGHHLLFESFSDRQMDEIRDSRNPQGNRIDEPIKDESPNDRQFIWKEEKVYEDQQSKLEESELEGPKPVIKQPKKLNKEKKQSVPKVNPVEARKAKLKADHQKVLAQIEQDQQRIENMNNYKWINREFL